ncbi:MAG: hypothetical protein MR384_04640 [Lachnospiraceae bacterium]|nr:hypothetical protein [Lachnospiraceae bacterium]
MEKIWDVTITKMGSIEIAAESEEEAIEKIENMNITGKIQWEDAWNAVDACVVSK